MRKAFAILFASTMVFELEEAWLLYATAVKAAINKQFKVRCSHAPVLPSCHA